MGRFMVLIHASKVAGHSAPVPGRTSWGRAQRKSDPARVLLPASGVGGQPVRSPAASDAVSNRANVACQESRFLRFRRARGRSALPPPSALAGEPTVVWTTAPRSPQAGLLNRRTPATTTRERRTPRALLRACTARALFSVRRQHGCRDPSRAVMNPIHRS